MKTPLDRRVRKQFFERLRRDLTPTVDRAAMIHPRDVPRAVNEGDTAHQPSSRQAR